MVFQSYNTIPLIHNFFKNLVSQSLTTDNRLVSSYINNLYLYSGWISALFCLAAQRRSLAGLRPRPQREVVILASVVSIWSYDYPLSMFTQIRGQCHLTVQVKIGCPTSWLNSLNLSPAAAKVHLPLVLYAALLTQLLAHPLWVSYCLYSKSGLFWANWLSGQNNIPTMLNIWRIIYSSSSTS